MSNFNHSRFLNNWDSEDDHANIAEYRYKYKLHTLQRLVPG